MNKEVINFVNEILKGRIVEDMIITKNMKFRVKCNTTELHKSQLETLFKIINEYQILHRLVEVTLNESFYELKIFNHVLEVYEKVLLDADVDLMYLSNYVEEKIYNFLSIFTNRNYYMVKENESKYVLSHLCKFKKNGCIEIRREIGESLSLYNSYTELLEYAIAEYLFIVHYDKKIATNINNKFTVDITYNEYTSDKVFNIFNSLSNYASNIFNVYPEFGHISIIIRNRTISINGHTFVFNKIDQHIVTNFIDVYFNLARNITTLLDEFLDNKTINLRCYNILIRQLINETLIKSHEITTQGVKYTYEYLKDVSTDMFNRVINELVIEMI